MSTASLADRRGAIFRPTARRIPSGLPLAIGCALGGRVLLGIVGALVQSLAPGNAAHTLAPFRSSLTSSSSSLWIVDGPWERDDGLWYMRLGTGGYRAHGGEAAFYPLYPGLTWLASAPTRIPWTLAALLLSTIFLAAGLYLVHRLVSADLGPRVATGTVLILAVSPTAFYLWAPYTEALFLALSAGCLLLARRGHLVLAGILAAAATATRFPGIALAVPIAVEAALRAHSPGTPWRPRTLRLRPLAAGALAVALPVLVVGGFFLYTRSLGFAGGQFQVQYDYWHQRTVPPWVSLIDSVRSVLGGAHPEEIWNLVSALGLVAVVALGWRRLPPAYTAYAGAMLVVVFCHEASFSPLMSASRFVAVVIPAAALLAQGATRIDLLRRVLVIAFPLVMIARFALFVQFQTVA